MQFRFNGVTVDTLTREVTKGKKEIKLFRSEFDLLIYLCANKGLALCKIQILKDVFGRDYTGTERSVDQCISQIRKKLGLAGKAIKTLYTLGYKFKS